MAAPLGNKNGAKAKIWEQAIKRALARRVSGTIDKGLDELADKLVEQAANGDQWALLEVGNRMDGKAAQAVMIDGDGEGGPVRFERIVREIVHAGT